MLPGDCDEGEEMKCPQCKKRVGLKYGASIGRYKNVYLCKECGLLIVPGRVPGEAPQVFMDVFT